MDLVFDLAESGAVIVSAMSEKELPCPAPRPAAQIQLPHPPAAKKPWYSCWWSITIAAILGRRRDGLFGSGLLVDEIGIYEGTVPVTAGPALVIVNANGE